MKKLLGCASLLIFLFIGAAHAQEYFTDLNGFRLKQYREVPQKELGKPFETKTLDDGFEYDAFMLKPDGVLYMVFEYAPDQTDIIWSIQISGTDAAADLGFRGVHFGIPAAEVQTRLGPPTRKIDIGEYGKRWEYDKSNFSIEINPSGKLSSIKIKDISDKVYLTPDAKKLPRLEEIVKVLTTSSDIELAKLIAPDVEVYSDGATLAFQKSLKTEIATDYSKVFATVRALAQELKSVNTKDPEAYEENMRLIQGQAPKHALKFKKGGKIKEIVFKYEWGEFLIFELDAGNKGQSSFDAYQPRTLREIVSSIAERSIKNPDVVLRDAKQDPVMILSYNSYPSHVLAIYTGESRTISDGRKEVINSWLRVLGKPKEMADLFQVEYLFTENNVEYWLPVQKTVAAYFPKELKKGDSVTLYVAWLGGRYDAKVFDNIFLVNEFEKDK